MYSAYIISSEADESDVCDTAFEVGGEICIPDSEESVVGSDYEDYEDSLRMLTEPSKFMPTGKEVETSHEEGSGIRAVCIMPFRNISLQSMRLLRTSKAVDPLVIESVIQYQVFIVPVDD